MVAERRNEPRNPQELTAGQLSDVATSPYVAIQRTDATGSVCLGTHLNKAYGGC